MSLARCFSLTDREAGKSERRIARNSATSGAILLGMRDARGSGFAVRTGLQLSKTGRPLIKVDRAIVDSCDEPHMHVASTPLDLYAVQRQPRVISLLTACQYLALASSFCFPLSHLSVELNLDYSRFLPVTIVIRSERQVLQTCVSTKPIEQLKNLRNQRLRRVAIANSEGFRSGLALAVSLS